MKKLSMQANAAAIDRVNLIEGVRASQDRLGAHARQRFDAFMEQQGGAIYEFASDCDLRQAFVRFEWSQLDRLYCELLAHLVGKEKCDVRSITRSIRLTVVDKLRRVWMTAAATAFRLTGKILTVTILVCLFVAISSITSEAVLSYCR